MSREFENFLNANMELLCDLNDRKTFVHYSETSINPHMLELLCDPNDRKTFVHYSGTSINQDLAAVSADIYTDTRRLVTDDEGSGHRVVMIETIISTDQRLSLIHI